MSSPAHSFRIAVAAPATTPLVRQSNTWPDAPQKAISVPCNPSSDPAISTFHSRSKDSRTIGYHFLCCPVPVPAIHLEANGKMRPGRLGAALLAFRHKLQCGIEGPDFDGFVLPEDPIEQHGMASERMHLTLKTQTTRPAGGNSLQQQSKFDDFLEEFNNERPHEALDMKCPAEVYTPAIRRYGGLPELAYPFHGRVIHVTNCGRICLHRKKINLSTVFAGQALGIKEVEEGIWLVSFMQYDLGYIDLEEKTLQPLDNPFGPKV
jgi:hypothetical protein